MSVVVAVGPNPALDLTYRVPTWQPGDAHRVEQVTVRAGGKATNVVRVVRDLGGDAHLVAPLGGTAGDELLEDLRVDATPVTVINTDVPTRRSVAVVNEAGQATVFNEAGQAWPGGVASGLLAALDVLMTHGTGQGRAGLLTINGSLPAGMGPALIGELIACARRRDVPVLVDTSAYLLDALDHAPDVVKPNRDELLAATGCTGADGIQALWQRSPGTVVVASDGPRGVLCGVPPASRLTSGPMQAWASADATLWHVPTPSIDAINPTGAGDALVAALSVAILRGDDPRRALRWAVAAGAAATRQPLAGVVDADDAWMLVGRITPRPEALTLEAAG